MEIRGDRSRYLHTKRRLEPTMEPTETEAHPVSADPGLVAGYLIGCSPLQACHALCNRGLQSSPPRPTLDEARMDSHRHRTDVWQAPPNQRRQLWGRDADVMETRCSGARNSSGVDWILRIMRFRMKLQDNPIREHYNAAPASPEPPLTIIWAHLNI